MLRLRKLSPKSSGHHKDQPAQGNSMKLSKTSPQIDSSYRQVSWGYDQTAATHDSASSQYQAGSVSGLPPARVWPDGATVPSQKRLDYDLLGLSQSPLTTQYVSNTTTRYISQNLECPYHQTMHEANCAEQRSENGLGSLDRFLGEAQSEQGAVYFGENIWSETGVCCCWGMGGRFLVDRAR